MIGRNEPVNHKVLLLNTGFSLYSLMQQNPALKEQFELLGLNFGNEVMVSDRQQLINQISQSLKSCRLLLIVDNAPALQAREILAQGFNKPLHQDEQAQQDIREYLSQNGRMANQSLQSSLIPQDAVPLSDPGCGKAGFAMLFPNACVALVSGSSKEVLRLVANQLFPLLLHKLYPGAVTADIPILPSKLEEVEDYIDRTAKRRAQGFLPILGGTQESPILRLIALKEDEHTSRQCCNSFLEDLSSECGKVSSISGLGTRGLRAVEKKFGRRKQPVAAFATNAAAVATSAAAASESDYTSYPPAQTAYDDSADFPEEDDDLYVVDEEEPEEELFEEKSSRREKKSRKRSQKSQKQEEDKPTRSGRSPVVKVLLVILILIFIGSIGYLGYYYYKSAQNRANYESLREVYDSPTLFAPSGYPDDYDKSFAGLWEINPDVVGWISIDGTDLDYPVVQTTDNTKYYRMNFEGEYSEHAVPFVDAADDLKAPSTNIIIYGHNIRTDGQMFNILKGYTSLEYYQQHPVVQFDSVYHKGKYKIISIFYTNTHSEHGEIFPYHEFIDAKDSQEAQEYIDDVLIRSIINTGVDVLPSDQLLTLSTCSYEFQDARFVIVARKVRDGESESVDTSQAAMNPNPLYPDIWYQLFGGTKPDEAALKAALPHYSAQVVLDDSDVISALAEQPQELLQDSMPMSVADTELDTGQTGGFNQLEDTKYAEASPTQQTSPPETEPQTNSSGTISATDEAVQALAPAPETIEQPDPPAQTTPAEDTGINVLAVEEIDQQAAADIEDLHASIEQLQKQDEPSKQQTGSSLSQSTQLADQEEEEAGEEDSSQSTSSQAGKELSVKIDGKTTRGSARQIVAQIVQAEMGPTFQPEALKAQAVAAYTYVLYNNQQGISPWVASSSNVSSAVQSAVDAVLGQAIYYNGSYINATYCASNAGQSMDAEHVWGSYLPYLVSVDSPGDTTLKAYGATKTFSEQEIADYIEEYCQTDPYDYGDPEDWFSDPQYINGLYVDSIQVCGQRVTGRKVRENMLHSLINSAAFEVEYHNGSFTFTTYGYGHGVGMSQQGADYYAMQGWNYVDILTHYYPGTSVQ